jgi:hypothetical protein
LKTIDKDEMMNTITYMPNRAEALDKIVDVGILPPIGAPKKQELDVKVIRGIIQMEK